MHHIKILIVDQSRISARQLFQLISRTGLTEEIRHTEDISKIEETIAEYKPDIIVSDIFLRGGDGFSLAERYKAMNPTGKAIAISNFSSEFIQKKAFEYGFDYYFVKPLSQVVLTKRLRDIAEGIGSLPASVENSISEILLQIGMAANLLGYKFFREAIRIVLMDPQAMNDMTEKVYRVIAEKYGSTIGRVERNMRHAIEVTWMHGSLEDIDSYFGYTVDANKGKPSNSAFIATIADAIRIKNLRIN